MGRYAEGTDVGVDKSRAEIEKLLRKFGADQFASGWEDNQAFIQFRLRTYLVRYAINIPDPKDREFTHTPSRGKERSTDEAVKLHARAVKAQWRGLLLLIKGKLVAVEEGFAVFEREFLGNVVLGDNSTIGDRLVPVLSKLIKAGKYPRLLPLLKDD